jgi:hypothetical protein
LARLTEIAPATRIDLDRAALGDRFDLRCFGKQGLYRHRGGKGDAGAECGDEGDCRGEANRHLRVLPDRVKMRSISVSENFFVFRFLFRGNAINLIGIEINVCALAHDAILLSQIEQMDFQPARTFFDARRSIEPEKIESARPKDSRRVTRQARRRQTR